MRPLNVLLIDDDEDDRDVFQSAIATVNSCPNCIVLEDAADALKQLEDKLLAPDVIFLDLNMPKMDGREFFLKIKANQDLMHIPIVLFSTSSFLESVQSQALINAHFIAKPDSFSGLKLVLQHYLESHFSRVRKAG